MYKVATEHQLVLSSIIIEELKSVTARKFKNQVEVINRFLTQYPFGLAETPKHLKLGRFTIRDEEDYPILYSAIIADADAFITGDNDFIGLEIEKPEIITPGIFLKKY